MVVVVAALISGAAGAVAFARQEIIRSVVRFWALAVGVCSVVAVMEGGNWPLWTILVSVAGFFGSYALNSFVRRFLQRR